MLLVQRIKFLTFICTYLLKLTIMSIPADAQSSTEEDLIAIQTELEASCCAIPEVDCSFVGRLQRRKRRGVNKNLSGLTESILEEHSYLPDELEGQFYDIANTTNFDHVPSTLLVNILKKRGNGNFKWRGRKKRQAELSERFIDQLGINLIRFETCLCQSNLPTRTCRMLFPPDFYTPNTPNAFQVAFQEEQNLKRFGCAFYSGSVVECTLIVSLPYAVNSTEEVKAVVAEKVDQSGSNCIMCNSLFCTFDVFKNTLLGQFSTFNQNFSTCVQNRSSSLMTSFTSTSSTIGTTAQPPPETTISRGSKAPFRPGTSDTTATSFTHHLTQEILNSVKGLKALPRFSAAGIFLGIGQYGGNTSLADRYVIRPGQSFHQPVQHHDHHKHMHDDFDHWAVIGAIIGGALLGAIIMAAIIFALYKHKLFTQNVKMNRSLRGLPIVKIDVLDPTPYCGPTCSDAPPPVARVVPLKAEPRRPSIPVPPCLPFRVVGNHNNGLSFYGDNPYALELDDEDEDPEYRQIYSRVNENEETFWEEDGRAFQTTSTFRSVVPSSKRQLDKSQSGLVLLDAQDYLAHYEVPVVTRPKSEPSSSSITKSRVPPPLPLRREVIDEMTSDWSDSTTWDDEERQRDLADMEHEYMELRPEPTQEEKLPS